MTINNLYKCSIYLSDLMYFSNVFYSDEELLESASIETRPAVNPEKDVPTIFNDSSIRLNIFSRKLTPNNLSFWKKWEDDRARFDL